MAYFGPNGEVLGEDDADAIKVDPSTTIKAAQAQLTCVPFSVPYAWAWGAPGENHPLVVSSQLAKDWGLGPVADIEKKAAPYNYIIQSANAPPTISGFDPVAVESMDGLRGWFFSRLLDTRYYESPNSGAHQISMLPGVHHLLTTLPPTPHPDGPATGTPEGLIEMDNVDYDADTGIFNEQIHLLEPDNTLHEWAVDILKKTHPISYDQQSLGNVSFLDATFTIQKAFAEVAYKAALGEELGISDPVRVQAHYNFYMQPYENIIKEMKYGGPKISETVIPNLYALMIDMPKLISPANPNVYDLEHGSQWQFHSTDIGKYVPAAQMSWFAHKIAYAYAPTKFGGGIETFNEYLNKFAEALKKASESTADWNSLDYATDPTWKEYDTTGISAYKIKDYMEEADTIKKFFPMHVDIEVPAANGGKIGKILYEASLFDQFMQVAMAALYPRGSSAGSSPDFYWSTAIIKKDSAIYDNPDTKGVDLTTQKDTLYRESLINLWLNDILDAASMPDLDNFKIPSQQFEKIKDSEATAYMKKLNKQIAPGFQRPIIFGKKKTSSVKFINNLKWLAAKNKINNFIKEKTRSVREIYDGKQAYSEVLFYEIVKFRRAANSDAIGGTFVQNIFLPNTPQVAVLKYIDTQLKYDADYYYQVYAHTIVVGTQYQYLTNSWAYSTNDAGISQFPKFLTYKYAPSVFLTRVPYYNTAVTMGDVLAPKHEEIDFSDPAAAQVTITNAANIEETPIVSHPPVFPDATFIPLYGEKNKILLNANLNVGEYDLVPEFITADEEDLLKRIRKNQRKMQPGSKITYKEDDHCGQIEILRTENRPLSWGDFDPLENHLIGYAGGSSNFGQIVEQKPNKDYYYTVRAQDVHKYYSNPSPIYHIRIVNKDGEAPYAIIRMFFIDEVVEKKTVSKKDLMKYIRIQPTFKQSDLDQQSILLTFDSVDTFVADLTAAAGKPLKDYIGSQPPVDKTVFGNKYKFRFTSKKTGRKFDLNLLVKNPYQAMGSDQSTQGETDNYSSGKC
jgi:hypothetical protein